MKDQFPGYIRPTADEIKGFWREGLFVPDANVLLDLYRISQAARADLFAAFKALGDRLWVPHQSAFEYHRSRYKVMLERRAAPARIDDLVDEAEEKLVDALQAHERAQLRDPGAAEFGDVAKKHFAELRSDLAEREKARQESVGIDASLDVDPIYDELSALCNGRVGAPFSNERLSEIYEEGKRRYADKVPPGFMDAEKPEPERYGDLVLWQQIIAKAMEAKQPVILITADVKEDWVWRVSGETIGPRPELVSELQERAQVPFYLYRTHRFLEFARSELGLRDVSDEAIEEVRQSQPDDTSAVTWNELNQRLELLLEAASREPAFRSPNHLKLEQGVVLSVELENAPLVGALVCTVVGPGGKEALATFGLEPDSSALRSVAVLYPDGFRDAGELRPGHHSVQWSLVRPGREGPAVRDSFVID